MLAKMAIVDPELTYDLPPALTASTGLDALTQLIEPFVCLRANPMTDGLCVEGILRAGAVAARGFRRRQNKSAREDMALASLLGGLALANAGWRGPRICRADWRQLSAPHGAVCAACCRTSWQRTSARSGNARRTAGVAPLRRSGAASDRQRRRDRGRRSGLGLQTGFRSADSAASAITASAKNTSRIWWRRPQTPAA